MQTAKETMMRAKNSAAIESLGGRPNVILASKRPPLSAVHSGNRTRWERSPGGLVEVIEPSLIPGDRWIAPSIDGVLPASKVDWIPGVSVRHAPIDRRTERLYDAVCNRVLWFALHGLPLPHLSSSELIVHWEDGFRRANLKVAEALAEEWKRRPAPILIQDFQLFLVPAKLRALVPQAEIAFFCHTPFPGIVDLRALPFIFTAEILRGLLACDLVGFQTHRDLAAFSRACMNVLGLTPRRGQIVWEGRRVRTGVFPAGVDPERLRAESSHDLEVPFRDDRQVITWAGRTDPAKNPAGAVAAFHRLLEERSEKHGRVHLWMKMYPSRQNIPEYRACLMETQELAIRLNAEFARHDWAPVLLDFSTERARALAALRRADVVLVNSLADGMNLVVQEGVLLSDRTPSLVLSRGAGAWETLAEGAISVDPARIDEIALGLGRALDMPLAERARRYERLLSAVCARSPTQWLNDQLDALCDGEPLARVPAEFVIDS